MSYNKLKDLENSTHKEFKSEELKAEEIIAKVGFQ